MLRRIIESVPTILGATILSLIPFFQTGANMNTLSWYLVGFGIVFILIGVLYGIFKHRHTIRETMAIVKQREQDLPEVKKYLAQYIARVEYLAKNDTRLYNLEQYKKVYFPDGIKGIRRYIVATRPNEAYYYELSEKQKIWKDNAIYRVVKKEDTITNEALEKLDGYILNITDKKLRKYIQAIIKTSHLTYSMMIWFNFANELFQPNPKISNMNSNRARLMLDFYLNRCSGASKRIDELLAGEDYT